MCFFFPHLVDISYNFMQNQVTVPALASVYNEKALKASLIPVFTFRYVSIWLVVLPWHSILSYLANAFMICVKLMIAIFISCFQNLFLYGYGAIFNFLGLVITAIIQGNYWECMSTWKQRAYCIVVLKCSIELSKVVNYSRLYKYYFF